MTSAGPVDLSVNIGALRLRNPIIAASGTFGYGLEFAHLIDLDAIGAFVTKGLSLNSIQGSPAPRLCHTPSGMLNAVGLQNVGVRAFVAEKLPVLRKFVTPVLVNIFGYSPEQYAEVIRILEDAPGIAGYELNVSCPNVKQGGIQFGSDPATVSEVVGIARRAAVSRPLWVKLSPLVTDIRVIAKAAEEAGADGLTVANTYPAMSIDVKTRRSRLGCPTGGLSGPAIRPITLRLVWEAAKVVKIPIIGLGGIETVDDVLEYLSVGARAVQVGTANFVSPTAIGGLAAQLNKRATGFNVQNIQGLTEVLVPKMD
ncbi:MAG TPA: dihydroorotate dehydrogenase [Candidatus Acidoferrum sp.]|nr:dihydroorotate dehydrogenase [Candidatus Acidoferrum sp.]